MELFACDLLLGNSVYAGAITIKNTGHIPDNGYNDAGGADENGVAEWQSFDRAITHRFDLRSYSYRSPVGFEMFMNGRCPEGDAYRAPTSALRFKFSSRHTMVEFSKAVEAAMLNVKALLQFMPEWCLERIFELLDSNAQKALKLTARTFRYDTPLVVALPSVTRLLFGAARLPLPNALKLVDWALGSALARDHSSGGPSGMRGFDIRLADVERAAIRGALAGGSFKLLYHVAKRTKLTAEQYEMVQKAYGPKLAGYVKQFIGPRQASHAPNLVLGDVDETHRVIFRTGRRSDDSTYVYPINIVVDDDDVGTTYVGLGFSAN